MSDFAEFRLKPVICHALRYDGSGPSAERISRTIGPAIVWPEFHTSFDRGGDFTGNLILERRGETRLVQPGMWIIRYADGSYDTTDDAAFRDTFEPWTQAAEEMLAAYATN